MLSYLDFVKFHVSATVLCDSVKSRHFILMRGPVWIYRLQLCVRHPFIATVMEPSHSCQAVIIIGASFSLL